MIHVLIPDEKMKTKWINFIFIPNSIKRGSVDDIASKSDVTVPGSWVTGVSILGLIEDSLVSFFVGFWWKLRKRGWFDPFRSMETKSGIIVGRNGCHGRKRKRNRSCGHGGA